MKIFNAGDCEIGITEDNTYIVKYKKDFYKLLNFPTSKVGEYA